LAIWIFKNAHPLSLSLRTGPERKGSCSAIE
jgi:hypothetical protein